MGLPSPVITEEDVHAVRAWLDGTATKDQQLRSARWIGTEVCRVFDSPYAAEGTDRDTFVAIGRHQVGVMITAMRTEKTLNDARQFDAKQRQGKS